MPTPVVVGNWKMNTTISEARALAVEMKSALASITGVTRILCPPFISLQAVREILQGTDIKLGAQNMYFEDKGAFTGEISSLMLSGLCQYVILGHSERRHILGESDSLINKKVKAALKAHLCPILCVGEKNDEREAGKAEEVSTRQIKQGLEGITSPGSLIIAYEPVWAIGTGKAATPEIAQSMMAHIRRTLSSIYGDAEAKYTSLLYGGSVTSENIAPFAKQPDINGALVGGASLKPKDFAEIARQIAHAKN